MVCDNNGVDEGRPRPGFQESNVPFTIISFQEGVSTCVTLFSVTSGIHTLEHNSSTARKASPICTLVDPAYKAGT
jgi:hypothetical protein